MNLQPMTLADKLEALALQGGTVDLHFNPYLSAGRGAWICKVTCEDNAAFEGQSPEGPLEAVEDCYNRTFADGPK